MGARQSTGKAVKATIAKDPDTIFRKEGHVIDEALRKGVRDALLRHKAHGNPVAIERDGKVIWVRAEDLLVE
jgi:isoaspartyl peptidase/L-asparaginase-like protein (Ntn-hydrolase superfamily)